MATHIKRPLITEKSMLRAQRGWYTFAVEKHARKEEIAKTVSKLYNVTVIDVRTVSRVGKMRRSGRKMIASRGSDWKTAMVKLTKGHTIPVFEVTGSEQKG